MISYFYFSTFFYFRLYDKYDRNELIMPMKHIYICLPLYIVTYYFYFPASSL